MGLDNFYDRLGYLEQPLNLKEDRPSAKVWSDN
jgi:hypothetical protein